VTDADRILRDLVEDPKHVSGMFASPLVR